MHECSCGKEHVSQQFSVSIESLSIKSLDLELRNITLSFSANVPADTYSKLVDMLYRLLSLQAQV